jgi:hypothetical protein
MCRWRFWLVLCHLVPSPSFKNIVKNFCFSHQGRLSFTFRSKGVSSVMDAPLKLKHFNNFHDVRNVVENATTTTTPIVVEDDSSSDCPGPSHPQERSRLLERGSLLERSSLQERSPLLERESLLERSLVQERSPLQERNSLREHSPLLERRPHLERSSHLERTSREERSLLLASLSRMLETGRPEVYSLRQLLSFLANGDLSGLLAQLVTREAVFRTRYFLRWGIRSLYSIVPHCLFGSGLSGKLPICYAKLNKPICTTTVCDYCQRWDYLGPS